MITNMMYCFVDETKTEIFGTKIYSMLFNQDGSVDVLTKLGSHAEEITKYPTQQDFANALPVMAARVMQWMREHGRKIENIQFPEKTDLVPITKRCTKCGKVKPILEFPTSEFSPDGTHKECCDCRVQECQKKKLYCSANNLPESGKFGDDYLRFERCKGCPVGEP